MRDIQVGDSAMLECERCRAVWVDAATFEHICASGESQWAVMHQFAASATRRDTRGTSDIASASRAGR